MIEIKECSKSFGTLQAVSKVSLDIGEREVFGLVGSNGAGKSTLLRMAAGILRPDEGEIRIDDISVFDNEDAKSRFFIFRMTAIFLQTIPQRIWLHFTVCTIRDLNISASLN